MYEEQRRKENVEATAQLESVRPVRSRPLHRRIWISFSGSTTPPCSARPTASRATPATPKTSCKPSSCACSRRQPDAEAVGNMEGYLRRAAVNAALDLIRSRQSAPQVPLDDVAPLLPENASLAPDRLHRSSRNPPLAATSRLPAQPPGRRNVRPALLRRPRQSGNRPSPRHYASQRGGNAIPHARSHSAGIPFLHGRNQMTPQDPKTRSAPRTSPRRNSRRTHRPRRDRSRRQPRPGAPRTARHAAHVRRFPGPNTRLPRRQPEPGPSPAY